MKSLFFACCLFLTFALVVSTTIGATAISPFHFDQQIARESPFFGNHEQKTPPPPVRPGGMIEPTSLTASLPIINWEYDQIHPAAAYNNLANEYLVVWEDHHWGWGNDWDIIGRRVGADGTPLDSEQGISWDGEKHRMAPDVAANTVNDEYLVVWEYEFSSADHDIYARRVGSEGSPTGDEFAITTSTKTEGSPTVAYNPAANEYLVVWMKLEGSDEFTNHDIVGQRVSADGSLLGASINIASSTIEETAPDVVCNSTNSQYIVVWQAKQPGTVEFGIYAQRMASNGSLSGSQITVSNWSDDQLQPRLAYDNEYNRFLVVWEDHHWGAANGWYIYGQMIDANGSLVNTHRMISGGDTKNRLNPVVVYQPSARSYLVAWELEFSATEHDVYSRRVAYDGTTPESEAGVSILNSQEGRPAVAAGSDWNVLIAWEDGRSQATNALDLYVSVLTMDIPMLSGKVYAGDTGVETDPMAGVTVELYCSSNAGDLGAWMASATTNEQGWYGLPAYSLCEYYQIIETDPSGYLSSGSTTVGGFVVTSNWIRYTHPLVGKVWSGNKFWDYLPGPDDTVPPGNWANFQPSGWVNSRSVTCAVQVEDTYSGLDVGTAQIAHSSDSGASWSPWQPASCSGLNGTTSPQTITAAGVPFDKDTSTAGLNRCKFRISDTGGNTGESEAYPVLIDTVQPQNPTSINCPQHPPSTWSTISQVTCQWAGAIDNLSGVAGYSIDWDHVATTVPAPVFETTSTQDSLPLSDSSSWYLHLRTLDQAGNAAVGAAHYGPIKIDSVAPTARLTAPVSGDYNTKTVTVSWTGGDNLSGIASYDVQSSTNGSTWSDWRMGVTYLTATFTGERGNTYYFRVRARDKAGNLSAWTGGAQASIGVDITVRVRNESSTNLLGAKVYYAGEYVGVTNASGLLTINDALLGESLAAIYKVYDKPASKPNHQWSWRVYLTSVDIPNIGEPQLFTITNTGAAYQELTVRKDQALIGVHLFVWVQWDANSTYLADLKQGLKNASAFLYDVTDGQIFFETVEIFDNSVNGPAGDMNIYASKQVWPNAFIGAIENANFGRMYLPRDWGGTWSSRDAYSTMIHEFGHYGLWLYDEYLDRDGKSGGFCTHNRGISWSNEPTRASIMDNQGNASELCSRADSSHLHNTNTEQDKQNNGETCWETVMRKYKDSASPSRWTLQSPDTRQVAVVPGPNAIPVAGWVNVTVNDSDTNACAAFTRTIVHSASGLPAEGVEVSLEIASGTTIIEGLTDNAGQIVIVGAHNGDILRAKKDNLSGWTTVSCAGSGPARMIPSAELAIQPDPFKLTPDVIPLGGYSVQVQVQASQNLAAAPQVALWQTGATAPISVPMIYQSQSGRYLGQALLNSALDPRGQLQMTAANLAGQVVNRVQAFAITPVTATKYNPHLSSPDGNFELTLPPGGLDADAFLSIQSTTTGSASQDDLVRVGLPYQVVVSTGQSQLNVPAVVNVRFYPEPATNVILDSLRLYRWDETQDRWIAAGTGMVNVENNMVSTEVNQLSVFALFGRSVQTETIHLPLIFR